MSGALPFSPPTCLRGVEGENVMFGFTVRDGLKWLPACAILGTCYMVKWLADCLQY